MDACTWCGADVEPWDGFRAYEPAGGRRAVDVAFRLGWRSDTPLDAASLAEYRAAYTTPSVREAMLGYYRAAARPRAARLVRTLARRSVTRTPAPHVEAS